jgi:hypothetical protein
VDVTTLVPGAIGIALAPLTVAAVVFLLGRRQGPWSAAACAAGWITAITVGLVVAVLVGERLPAPGGDGSPVQAVVALAAGVLLAGLAVWQWRVRLLPDGSPASARWSEAVEAVGPLRAFGVGLLLFLSPKLFVLVLAAGLAFGDADPGAATTWAAGAGFVLVAGSTALLPIVLTVVLGRRAQHALAAVRAWIARWGSVMLAAVLAVLAAVQVAVGGVGLLQAA